MTTVSVVSNAFAEELIAASPSAKTPAVTDQPVVQPAEAVPPFLKATTQIVVNISINGEPRGDYFVELDDEGGLYLKKDDLAALMLRFAEDRMVLIRNERYVPLTGLRDVRTTFDDRNLTLAIMGRTTEDRKTDIALFPIQTRPQNVYQPRETSAFLNYGLTYSYSDISGFQSFTAVNKLGLRSGDVFFVSDSVYTKTELNEHIVRLQSSATYERRGDLQWLVVGDQFANSGDLGSAVNMGGIGFSKVYKLDPYFITQPLFSLRGVAEFPSQSEIYLDGALVGKQQIAPGAFELKNIYSYSGAHTLEVLLRDPFGNERKISYPLYFSPLLLGEGLHEYGYHVGFLRERYGEKSDEYGKPVYSGFHRYGVSSSLNIGARAEGTEGVSNGGVSTSFLIPRAGAFTLSVAASAAAGANGSARAVQHSYQLGSFSTNLLLRSFSREYATVGAQASPDRTRYETSLGLGFLLPVAGGVSLSYSRSEAYSGADIQATGASYSLGLSRSTSLYASASATRSTDTTYGFFVGLNFSLDKNLRGAASYNKTVGGDTETAQLQKDIPVGEGLGYRASLTRIASGAETAYSFNPFLQYNASYGTFAVDSNIRNATGQTHEQYSATAAGALVYAEGFYGISRPVSDSFGIVMVDRVPNAAVLNNGQEIGKTGVSGTMVIPSLASYNQNQITVDTKNIPLNYSVSGVNAVLSPSQWSGSCVAFDAREVQAVTGRVYVKNAEKAVPLEYYEITMKVGERMVTFPTGKGGEFYVENALPDEDTAGAMDKRSCQAIAERRKSNNNAIRPGMYQASAEYEGKKCVFLMIFPGIDDEMTDLGEIQCMLSPAAGAATAEP